MKQSDSPHRAPTSLDLDLDLDPNTSAENARDPWQLLTPPPFVSACAAARDCAELAPARNRRGTKKRVCPKFR